MSSSGEVKHLDIGGILLGIMEDVSLDEDVVALDAGAAVVLFTDGISEATNAGGELFSDERVATYVASLPCTLAASEVAARILAEVERHLGEVEAQDDRTLVVLRVAEAVPGAVIGDTEPETISAF